MDTIYFEMRYCSDCYCEHWLEVTRSNREICHGESRTPRNDSGHYTRRLGRGIEEIEKSPAALPPEWQMLADARESVIVDQDW